MLNLRISLLKGKTENKLTLLKDCPDEDSLIKICDSPKLKERYRLEKGYNYLRYHEILNSIKKRNIGCISIENKEYPKLLKEIYDPPFLIYFKGDRRLLNSQIVSVVGTRKPSNRGYHCAFKLGLNLGKHGINVVSGLAIGIDGASHRGNILSGGRTVAVLGSAIDTIYPREHKELAAAIISCGGVIISEFPPGSETRKYNFPKRNRIVAGLSQNLVIIQAPKKSGALITGDFALEDGRDVWVHSIGIGDKRFLGSDRYFKEGARRLDSACPLIKFFGKKAKIEEFDKSDYSESDLLKMEIDGVIIKYRGEYFFK